MPFHRCADSPAEFGLRAHDPIEAGRLPGQSSRSLVLHQEGLDPVLEPLLDDPIGNRRGPSGMEQRLRKPWVSASSKGRSSRRMVLGGVRRHA
jgi:hypothetical protein